ncbi:hypothetical protein DQ04_21431000 [Trypanosoma grayi]|uniref:hypothetical protein n=1 Tax=Trypanosoma grayi TaxID=71804 RepID=UPI0004F489D5|nr:hypothetical protein DQ04_21431000 [Trypanosoma grayi]KEG05487.1 hypothetical protein DQ04_21431000 [Trypanosoma grayi]
MSSVSLTLNPNGSAQSLGSLHGLHSHPGGQSFNGAHSLHGSAPSTLRCTGTPQQPMPKYVEALDHLSTKLKIPASAVEPTNALQDDGLVPGICRLHLEGRCRQGSRCFQVHVHWDVLEALRKEALETPSCCYLHGAPCNYEGLPFNLTVNIGSRSIGLHSLSPTSCLWNAYNEHGENQLTVSKGRVCREHRRGLCRFGEECGFLHICREVPLDGEDYISATPIPTPRVNPKAGNTNGSPAANNNNGEASGEGCVQRANESHAEEGYVTAQSFNASSFTAASFNGGYPVGGLSALCGNGLHQCGSFLGGESACGSVNSFSRSRQSFSCRMKQMPDGDGTAYKAPLLRPLGGSQARNSISQRHNPYADASSPH